MATLVRITGGSNPMKTRGRHRRRFPGGPSVWRMAALIAAGLVVSGAAALAAQWIVDDSGPADFTSIQSAINAVYVHSGDTILVRPGRYYEWIWLDTKELVIRSEKGPYVTILDGQDSGSVVSLLNRSSATRIEGFTITHGRDQQGGGVWISGGGPVITRNVIEGNQAVGGYLGYGYGGGIEVYASAAVITRNIIRGNSALDGGGGIDVYYSGPSTPGTCCPLIAQNTIVGNTVTSPAGAGGGIFVYGSEPTITSSIFQGNRATRGGGIFFQKVQGNADKPVARSNLSYFNTPNDMDSNGTWSPGSSNVHADPRFGTGEWWDLCPRSDSPALDAAESGLAAGPDLTGYSSPVDSDLDGMVMGDVGAIENRGEITSLTVVPDPNVPGGSILTWDDSVNTAVLFHVYSGDGAIFKTTGGSCLAASLSTPSYTDTGIPPVGSVRYYVVTGEGAVEGSRGFRTDGAPRPAATTCTP